MQWEKERNMGDAVSTEEYVSVQYGTGHEHLLLF